MTTEHKPTSVPDLTNPLWFAVTYAAEEGMGADDINAAHDELFRLQRLEETRDRWAAFTHREMQDMHHALRMFAKYPGLSDEEAAGYTALADEIWERHAAQTAAAFPKAEL